MTRRAAGASRARATRGTPRRRAAARRTPDGRRRAAPRPRQRSRPPTRAGRSQRPAPSRRRTRRERVFRTVSAKSGPGATITTTATARNRSQRLHLLAQLAHSVDVAAPSPRRPTRGLRAASDPARSAFQSRSPRLIEREADVRLLLLVVAPLRAGCACTAPESAPATAPRRADRASPRARRVSVFAATPVAEDHVAGVDVRRARPSSRAARTASSASRMSTFARPPTLTPRRSATYTVTA